MDNKTNSFIQWLKYNEFRLIGLIFLVSLVLGYIGFYQYYERTHEDVNALQLLYLSFQLFIMESGAVNKPELTSVFLHIARWLAPGVLAYTLLKTILSVLEHEIYLLKLRKYKNHIIICGLGTKGQRLAETFHERGEKIVIIEKNIKNNLINHYKGRGVIVLIENALDVTVLKKARIEHAKYMITVTENDIANVNILKHAKDLKNKKNSDHYLTCFAHIQNTKLKSLLYEHEIFFESYDNFDARIFNIYENGARIALRKYPPDKYTKITHKTDPPVHILVLGYDKLGEAIVFQIARVAHYRNNKKTHVTVIDEDALTHKEKLSTRVPAINKIANFNFVSKDPETLSRTHLAKLQSVRPFNIIYFCIEDDTLEIDTLTRLKRLLPGLKAEYVLFTKPSTPIPKPIKDDNNIKIIELVKESCTANVVVDEELDKLAMLIHNDYLKRAKEDIEKSKNKNLNEGKEPPKQKSVMVEWKRLNEEYRDNNRSQADHIEVKLRAIKCESCPADDSRDEYDFTKEKIIMTDLAKMEHQRWNANRWLAGWRLGKRNDILKTHPDLVPWEKLNAKTKDYDIDAVANIPYLLSQNNKKVCKTG